MPVPADPSDRSDAPPLPTGGPAPRDPDADAEAGSPSPPGSAPEAPGRRRRPAHLGAAPARRPALRFGATALVALVGTAATWMILVGTRSGQLLENAALRGAEFRSEAERQVALDRLSGVSVTLLAVAILLCVLIGLLRNRTWLAIVVVVAMAGSVVAAELLKDVLGRPALVDGPTWLLRNSFPSGSAAVATALALALYLVVPDRLRWLALTFGVGVAAVISEAVQTSGWHRLSDTIGAALVAIAGSFAGLWFLARSGHVRAGDRGHVDPRLAGGLWLGAAIALGIGSFVLALLALFPVLTTPVDARQALLQTAFPLLGTGWTVASILAATRLVEPFTLGTTSPTTAPRNAADPDATAG